MNSSFTSKLRKTKSKSKRSHKRSASEGAVRAAAKGEKKVKPAPAEEKEEREEEEAPQVAQEQVKAHEEPVGVTHTGAVLADSFDVLAINEETKTQLREEFGFRRMTEIQALSIPPLLAGKNVLAEAKTGSGKTLAFLIPALEILVRGAFKPHNGTGVLVITPTRELALQILGVARDLMGGRTQTYGVIMGGANRTAEQEKLSKGVNLVIATPGRLLDHLRGTKDFVIRNLKALIIDEADRILQHGFEDEMRAILKLLPKEGRQTMLFSATQTKNVKQLARLSMAERPVFVTTKTEETPATVAGLQQGYIVCPADLRFLLLFTFVKRNMHRKVMVFMSSCNAVKHFVDLFNYIDVPVMGIYGKMKQTKRTNTFFEFCNADKGVLVCTDVAARGLDIPAVDWIIQYDPPDDTAEYIHRVGRTARAGSNGKALLFLMETELAFLKFLKQANVPLNEYSVPKEKIANIQNQLEKLIQKNYYLHQSARSAYRSYIAAYGSHALKEVFNVHDLDLMKISKSFGFEFPPKVQLNVKPRSDRKAGSKGSKKVYGDRGRRKDGKQWSN